MGYVVGSMGCIPIVPINVMFVTESLGVNVLLDLKISCLFTYVTCLLKAPIFYQAEDESPEIVIENMFPLLRH